MKLLALDTSTQVAGVALMEDDLLVCEFNLQSGLTHSQRLMPLVDSALQMAGWQRGELDAVAAVVGPGSFTGIRIGVATAQGIATALGIPTVGVGTLEVLAAQLGAVQGVILPLCDARRGQVYGAAYACENGVLVPLVEPCAMALEDLLALAPLQQAGCIHAVGDGALANLPRLQADARIRLAPVHLRMQRSGALAALGMARLRAGQALTPDALQADYRRRSQAEQAREAREHAQA